MCWKDQEVYEEDGNSQHNSHSDSEKFCVITLKQVIESILLQILQF